jgi:hypothetical protein
MLMPQKGASPDSNNIRKSLLTYLVQLRWALKKPLWLDLRGGPSAPSKLERTMTEGLGHHYDSFCFVGKSLGAGTGVSALSDVSPTLLMAFFRIFLFTREAEIIDF